MIRLFIGALTGLVFLQGITVMWRSIAPRHISLEDRLEAASKPLPTRALTFLEQVTAVFSGGSRATNSDRKADLALLGKTASEFAIERLSLTAALGAFPLALVALTQLSGAVSWNPATVMFIVVVGLTSGVAMAQLSLKSRAKERRRGWVGELTAYLDIVSLMLSAGEGPEGALNRAARSATSPGVEQIRTALYEARLKRQSIWDALSNLSQRLNILELEELVASVKLASVQGAPVKDSLMAKSQSLRDRLAAEELARSEVRSEKIGIPVAMMLLGFLLLMAGPYVAQLMTL